MDYQAKTVILHIDPAAPDKDVIARAAGVIRAGGLVAFPTETVYGLGADALNADAINRIYQAKRRPANDPLITHISNVRDIYRLAKRIPSFAGPLAEAFWPGPLTMIMQRAAGVPENVSSGLPTVAIRMPIHPVARALIEASGTPIAAPSANTFTRPSATTAAHVLEDLMGRVDIVIDGGPTPLGLESTVIDLTRYPPVVLRPGGIVLEDIHRIVPEAILAPTFVGHEEAASAPGQLVRHYAPRARLMLYEGAPDAVRVAITDTATRYIASGRRVGILTANQDAAHFTQLGARIISLGEHGDHAAMGRVLFGALRALDGQNVDVILAPLFSSSEGLGAAIRDRLIRAAEGKVYTIEG